MLKSKLEAFYSAVEDAKAVCGLSAPLIADHVIAAAFPNSYNATLGEGCDDMLRVGVIGAIKRYITKPSATDRQTHFNDIASDILPMVEPLNKAAYFVPSIGGADRDEDMKAAGYYVPVPELVTDLNALRAATAFMFSKSSQTREEAMKLDALLKFLESRL